MQRLSAIRLFLLAVLACPLSFAQSSAEFTEGALWPYIGSSFVSPAVSVLIFDTAKSGMPEMDNSHDATVGSDRWVTPRPERSLEPLVRSEKSKKEGFHWRRALGESGMFLVIQHAYLAHTDARWITAGTGVPFNHFWRDYMKSLDTWAHTGWDDGDPFLDNYIAHPIQGALTGYIQVQNDPKGARLEFTNTKPYWHSRLKAMAWTAAYSAQWEIGPLGEMTVEKYGTWDPWLQNGKWINGVGQVDLVVTPIGGLGWMVMEDMLDRYVARRVEGGTQNRFVVGFVRCAVNPIRGAANVLHGKWPWYRASRSASEVYYSRQFGGH